MIRSFIHRLANLFFPKPAALRSAPVVPPGHVVAVVAPLLGATADDVTGGTRYKGAVRARHASALALRRLGLSFPEIAVVIRWRDHSTAINAVRCAEARELAEPAFASAVLAGIAAGRGS